MSTVSVCRSENFKLKGGLSYMDEKKEITFSKFSKEFADKAFSQKKINVNESIVQQIVEKIFKHIHYFNSLKADEAIRQPPFVRLGNIK
jgi:hypothetical protein